MNKIIQSLQPQRISRVGGSANKFIHMIEGESDFYINLVPGFKNWDLCGSEALLLSRFGILSDAARKPLFYNNDSHNQSVTNGIVAATSKN